MVDTINKSLTNKQGAILSAGMFMEGFMAEMAFKLDYRVWVGFICEEQIDKGVSSG